MNDELRPHDFSLPESGSGAHQAFDLALRQTLLSFFAPEEILSIAMVLGTDSEGRFTDTEHHKLVLQLVELCTQRQLLHRLLDIIRELRPATWYEKIWPYIRPKSFVPPISDLFIGRYQRTVKILNCLLNGSSEQNLIVITGVSGIGKTVLANRVASLCKQHGYFESILWLEIKDNGLLFLGEHLDWARWLKILNIMFNWQIRTENHSEFAVRCWEKLREGKHVLFIDGLDHISGNEEVITFATQLEEATCKVVVTTQLPRLFRQNMLPISLGSWREEESIIWLQHTILNWNLVDRVKPGRDTLKELHGLSNGIPLALRWQLGQKASENRRNVPPIDSNEHLLETIFENAFRRLGPLAQKLLLSLSLFSLPVSQNTWSNVAQLQGDDFDTGLQDICLLNLVEQNEDGCFFLLAVTRSFTHQRLSTDPQLSSELKWRWIEYYRNFSLTYGGSRRHKFNVLDKDWANLWQATTYAIEQWEQTAKEVTISSIRREWGRILIDMANSLNDFCRVRNYREERLQLSRSAAEAADALQLPEHLGPLAYRVGWIECSKHEFGKAEAWGKWAYSVLEKSNIGRGYALRLLARIERDKVGTELNETHPTYHSIQQKLESAEKAFLEEMDKKGQARLQSDWGLLAAASSQYNNAKEHHNKALSNFEEIDDQEGIAVTLVNLGDACLGLQEFVEAHRYYHQALELAGKYQMVEVVADAQRGMADFTLTYRNPLKGDEGRIAELRQAHEFAQSADQYYTDFRQSQKIEELLQKLEIALSEYQGIGGSTTMPTAIEQLQVGILLESVKYLFGELGRRLEFWRKKKGETNPSDIQGVKVSPQNDRVILTLDDVTQVIDLAQYRILKDQIQTSLGILQAHSTTLNTYRRRLTDPNLSLKDEAFINQKVPELRQLIDEEANELQRLVEIVLR